MRSLLESGVEPVWPADHQCYVVALKLPYLELLCQGRSGQRSSPLIQRHDAVTFGNGVFNARTFGRVERIKSFRPTRFGLDGFEFYLQLVWKAFRVIVPRSLRPIWYAQSHCHTQQFHGELIRLF